MALINCPQCGHMISDKAKACPKCGYVLNNEQAKPVENIDDEESESQFDDCTPQQGGGLKWILIVLAILVIGGGVGYYFYADNKAKKEIALAAEQARLDSIEAARLDSLRQDSLRRDSIEFYKFTSPDLIAFDLKGHVKEMDRVGNLFPMPGIIPVDGFTSVTFSYNGEVQFSAESWMRNASRNGNGFLTQGHGKNSSCYVEWNGNNIIRQSYEDGRSYKKFSIPTYKDGRIVAYKLTEKRYGKIYSESDATIEYQDFDNYGNWISCVIKQTSRYPNGTFDRNNNRVPKEPTLKIDTLKREITYYTRTNYSDEEKEIKQRNAEFQKREEQKEQDEKKGPEWINGVWECHEMVDLGYFGRQRANARLSINRDAQTISSNNDGMKYNGSYYVSDNTIHFGDWYANLDNYNERIEYGNGIYYRKVSNSPSSSSNSSRSSHSTYNNSSNTTFRTPSDVLSYTSSNSFYNGGDRLRIDFDAVYLNGTALTGAPRVTAISGSSATVVANSPYSGGGTLHFYVNASRGTITQDGDVYRAR